MGRLPPTDTVMEKSYQKEKANGDSVGFEK
jgi:hypothetical protein